MHTFCFSMFPIQAPTRTSWTPVVSSISRVICLRKPCISITLRRVLFLRVLSRHADISTSIPACSTSFKTRRCSRYEYRAMVALRPLSVVYNMALMFVEKKSISNSFPFIFFLTAPATTAANLATTTATDVQSPSADDDSDSRHGNGAGGGGRSWCRCCGVRRRRSRARPSLGGVASRSDAHHPRTRERAEKGNETAQESGSSQVTRTRLMYVSDSEQVGQ